MLISGSANGLRWPGISSAGSGNRAEACEALGLPHRDCNGPEQEGVGHREDHCGDPGGVDQGPRGMGLMRWLRKLEDCVIDAFEEARRLLRPVDDEVDRRIEPRDDRQDLALELKNAGLKYREIADQMGKTDKFVDNTVQRLRAKLRHLLEAEPSDLVARLVALGVEAEVAHHRRVHLARARNLQPSSLERAASQPGRPVRGRGDRRPVNGRRRRDPFGRRPVRQRRVGRRAPESLHRRAQGLRHRLFWRRAHVVEQVGHAGDRFVDEGRIVHAPPQCRQQSPPCNSANMCTFKNL